MESEGVFDSGEPSRNVDYIFTFEIGMNGTYEYVCEPHEDMGMVGTIVVEALNTTEEEPGEIEEQAVEERSLSAPFLAGIVSLSMASSLIVDLRLSQRRRSK